ncbi:glycosyltransferase family A protein, partial [Staphylococcus hominis]
KILRDCLDSINQQTFGDFEVIFIHNGNTNLNEEIEKYNFKNKIIIEQKLENPQYYRNIGIQKASGEYVLFMDGDDYLHPNALIYAKEIIDETFDEVIK